jgi:putative SOS response-associated peptidase YedK
MSAKDRIRQAPVHSAPAAKDQSAIRDWFRASHDRTGNLPLFPAIFPDQLAPIVRVGADGERELVMARWGMPGPPQFGGSSVDGRQGLAYNGKM